ncbi:2-C-methyl-D-erythritol 2,4-cyclodiphosphate synthase [Spiroplasma chinense]|uniref:2-C-methyl-D-erythritol 2,4-cyclodiphosphate synthase n=1 Tax=Spiroplasma chinense TaxID=216932 RepID=A0A5B9Y6R0_9MOLU|nr:2-C-methyl-D-erythritol 2,4-cyclodiphosphate synthase [Spiroplasma chinense]QEH62389.1 2-C-methyl-D-erythritol 2,4-cyclodiphosphate synthase [Spiroplasma chinense]
MFRIGFSKDRHILTLGKGLTLGAVNVPSVFKAKAYSDGDVLLHAICESLYGAMGMDDLGTYFNKNTKPKGFSSTEIVEDVLKNLKEKEYKIENIDTLIVLDKPNLKEYKSTIKESVCNLFNLKLEQVSIKATTSEYTNENILDVFSNVLISKGE